MRFKGRFKSAYRDWETGRVNISFELMEGHISEIDEIKNKELSIDVKKFFDKRSGKANRLLWSCINEIAQVVNEDKWSVYLHYIKRQGQFTLVQIIPEALDKLKAQWREIEVIGHPFVDGREMLDVLCYFGSSTYNTKEFGKLLDEIISDMKDMNLPVPTSEEMRIALEEVEKNGKE